MNVVVMCVEKGDGGSVVRRLQTYILVVLYTLVLISPFNCNA